MYNELFGVWEKNGIIYVSKKHNPQLIIFSGLKSLKEHDFPIKRGEYIHKYLNYAVENGCIRFDSIPIREVVYDLINGGYREG